MITGSVIRRNDPCPCGSGLKFKKCCMNHVETMDQGITRLLRQEFDRINQSLYDYTQRNFKVALDRFYKSLSERHSLSYTLQAVLKQYVTIWGIFNLKVRDNRTSFDFYTERYFEQTQRHASKEMVQSWHACHFSAYAIESISSTGMMALEDVWTKEKTLVPVPEGNKQPNLQSLLVGLRVPITAEADEFLLGYAEVEGRVWSEAKLARIRADYLADPTQPLGEQFDENLPQIFIELVSEIKDEKALEAETDHMPPYANPERASNHLDSITEYSDENSEVPHQHTVSSSSEISGSRAPAFSGNESQQQVLSLYLEHANQDGELENRTVERVHGVWLEYVASVNPIIKKPEAFAAALDYFTNTLDKNGRATQTSISKKYGVSAGTISKNYRLLLDFAEATPSEVQKHA